MIDPMLPIPFALVQVASTSLLYAAPRPRNMVCSVPSRLGQHPGEATLDSVLRLNQIVVGTLPASQLDQHPLHQDRSQNGIAH